MPDRDDDGSIDEDLRGMEPGEQVAALYEWFRSRFAAPGSHATLAEYDDWLDDDRQPEDFATADRGPFEALDVLVERFGHAVDEEVLQKTADRLDRDSAEWIRIPEAERRTSEALFSGAPDEEDGLGSPSVLQLAQEELDAAMQADASAAERARVEQMLRDYAEQANTNDPAIVLAIDDAEAAAALVLERIQAVRSLHEQRASSLGGQGDGLPSRKHNNPPPDDDEIIDAVQWEIWEMGLERELVAAENEARSAAPDVTVLRRVERFVLRVTASAALSVVRDVGGMALSAAAGVVADHRYSTQILAVWQSLLVALRVLISHCGLGS
jgi:hypothetical protein